MAKHPQNDENDSTGEFDALLDDTDEKAEAALHAESLLKLAYLEDSKDMDPPSGSD